MRIRLVKALGAVPGFEVICQASDLPATYTAAEAMEPDVVLVARDLTRLPEFALMRSLFRALNARWITVDHRGLAGQITPAVTTAETASDNPPIDTGRTPQEIAAQITAALRRVQPREAVRIAAPIRANVSIRPGKLILIGASTGGVDALLAVLSALPADCPPVAVVQHTGQGFSESLIRLLDRRCAVTVEAAQDGMELRQGRVCVAAGCPGHMRLQSMKPYRIGVEPGPLVSGHLPSVDALFRSAVPAAANVVAALLTGMGRDGADGLLALRQGGAMTIGQDETSSVVYGMPKAAWEIGAVRQQLPLSDIAGAILRACAQGTEEGRMLS
ncbi:chemotaxis protein CheB [bacterium]|nr:chemotaxis protein CheB [bacterium]